MSAASDPRRCPEPGQNILFNPLPELSWDKTETVESSRKLADYVACEAQLAIRWYIDKKRPKKNWAQALRFVAIIATALAGLIPLLSEALGWLPATWGSAALIIAGAAVGLDRFFGFSSAWMRFLTTEIQIRQALHRFLFDWEAKQARLGGAVPDERTTQDLVRHCRQFIDEVNQILRDEMDEWVREFRQNLAEIDKAANARAQELGLGGLTLVVTNGDQCEDGWDLSLDDGAAERRRGRSAAFGALTAGPHVVRVSGVIAGQGVQAEAAFIAAQGRAEGVSVTLA